MLPIENHPYQLMVSDFSTGNKEVIVQPEQASWAPFKYPEEPKDFYESITTLMGAGDPRMKNGLAIHVSTLQISEWSRG